jgi:3-oxoacyl-[acyl-carrier protein] reductase
MKITLDGKTAMVGGSTRGIGKAVAVQLAASGAQVTLLARNEAKLKAAVADLPVPAGQKHGFLEVDFNDSEGFRKIVSSFLATQTIDILVNNTQGPAAGRVAEEDPASYQKAFDTLFQTVVFLTSAALPGMKQRGFGRIINVSSMSIRQPIPHLALSNIIRPAVAAWAKNLSIEVAMHGITVNNILTGYFDTERITEIYATQAQLKGITLEQLKATMAADVPARRFGRPEEYGYLAAFLASEQAAYITGTNIPIDGGLGRGNV